MSCIVQWCCLLAVLPPGDHGERNCRGVDIIPFLIIQVFKSVSTIQKVRTVCLMIYHTNIHTKVAQTS